MHITGIDPKRLEPPADPKCKACNGTGEIYWKDKKYGPCIKTCEECVDTYMKLNWFK